MRGHNRRSPMPVIALGLGTIMALGACSDEANAQTTVIQPATQPLVVQAPVLLPAAVPVPAVQVAPAKTGAGYLHFALGNGNAGPIDNWQIRVTSSLDNPGFKTFESGMMKRNESIRFDLWPGRYGVEIYHDGNLEYADTVDIRAGERDLIYVEFGFLSKRLKVAETEAEADKVIRVDRYTSLRSVQDNFSAPQILLPGNLVGVWTGALDHGAAVGTGKLDIYNNGAAFASMPAAQATPQGFAGNIAFVDQRMVDRAVLPGPSLADGTVTTWPDGRRFTGSYDGVKTASGQLSYADGTVWRGPVVNGQASGTGRLVASSGTWLEAPSATLAQGPTGQFVCGPAGDTVGRPCYYINGQQVTQAQYAAFQSGGAVTTVTPQAPIVVPRIAAGTVVGTTVGGTPVPASVGCTSPIGNFYDAKAERRLELRENGRGSLLQTNVDGPAASFSVSFSWSGAADSMYFDYDTAEYRAATGEVLQRTDLPDEAGSCSYDGSTLYVNGATYHRV